MLLVDYYHTNLTLSFLYGLKLTVSHHSTSSLHAHSTVDRETHEQSLNNIYLRCRFSDHTLLEQHNKHTYPHPPKFTNHFSAHMNHTPPLRKQLSEIHWWMAQCNSCYQHAHCIGHCWCNTWSGPGILNVNNLDNNQLLNVDFAVNWPPSYSVDWKISLDDNPRVKKEIRIWS